MERKTKEELRHDLIRQMCAFQNGVMTGFILDPFYLNSAELLVLPSRLIIQIRQSR